MSRFRQGWATVTYVLSIVTLVGLFIVNIVGFIDTETGSAFGCGKDWPLCNGRLIPKVWGLHTIIEFLHRGLVGVVTVILVIVAVFAWTLYGRRIEMRISVILTLIFVALEAFLGAMGVLFADPPPELAFHFGVSLMAFNGALLMCTLIRQMRRRELRGETGPLRTPVPDRRFARLNWIAIVWTYVAVYVGAYVSSSGDGQLFRGWPFPTETYAHVGNVLLVDYLHRLLALGLVVTVTILYVRARRFRDVRPDIHRGAAVALIFIVAQAFSGALLIASHTSTAAFLLHVSIVTLFFATLIYLALQAWPETRERVRTKTAAAK